jgi:hypothetical protein
MPRSVVDDVLRAGYAAEENCQTGAMFLQHLQGHIQYHWLQTAVRPAFARPKSNIKTNSQGFNQVNQN